MDRNKNKLFLIIPEYKLILLNDSAGLLLTVQRILIFIDMNLYPMPDSVFINSGWLGLTSIFFLSCAMNTLKY